MDQQYKYTSLNCKNNDREIVKLKAVFKLGAKINAQRKNIPIVIYQKIIYCSMSVIPQKRHK